MSVSIPQILFGACAAVYVLLASLIVLRSRHQTGFLLAVCCVVTAAWAAANVAQLPPGWDGLPNAADLLRVLSWYVAAQRPLRAGVWEAVRKAA